MKFINLDNLKKYHEKIKKYIQDLCDKKQNKLTPTDPVYIENDVVGVDMDVIAEDIFNEFDYTPAGKILPIPYELVRKYTIKSASGLSFTVRGVFLEDLYETGWQATYMAMEYIELFPVSEDQIPSTDDVEAWKEINMIPCEAGTLVVMSAEDDVLACVYSSKGVYKYQWRHGWKYGEYEAGDGISITNGNIISSQIPNANSSTVGGLKVRVDGTTLYITNDGSNA